MSLSIGIVGLPNVGKSTLFNALLKKQVALAANYPFATIEPNVGVVDVPDPRIEVLSALINQEYQAKYTHKHVPEKVIPAVVKFFDIAGLVKGAHKGEGLGNQFLGHIREVDAIVHLARAFDDPNIIREGAVTPLDDIETVNLELIYADLASMQKRVEKVSEDARRHKDLVEADVMALYTRIVQVLESGQLLYLQKFTEKERFIVKDLNLLTSKPIIHVLNVDENALSEPQKAVESIKSAQIGIGDHNTIVICAKLESELASLNPEEREAFLHEYGVQTSGLDNLIQHAYTILGLQTFFTAGPKEVHAWTYKQGTKAPQAAGIIHTDFEKGFISAQVCPYTHYVAQKNWKNALEKGLVRLEGKEYVMQDGDVVEFRFGV
jgi:GTP-binding protein YchF